MPKESKAFTFIQRTKIRAALLGIFLTFVSMGDATAKRLKTPQLVKRHKLLISIFAVILLFMILGAAGAPSSSPTAKSSSVGSGNTSPTSNSGSSNAVNVPAPPPSCTTYQALDSQSWLEIVKDPNAYQNECYTVYGEVTQFDSVTGTSSFFADVGGVAATPEYGFVSYPTLTYLTGDSMTLQTVVQQDLFMANVMVIGTETYKTVTGAQLTVPALQVNSIQVTGSLGN